MSTVNFNRDAFYACLREHEVALAHAVARRPPAARAHAMPAGCTSWCPDAHAGARAKQVLTAMATSEIIALRALQAGLGSLGIDAVWPILRELCHDFALYMGGSVLAGGMVGGGLGMLVFGVGTLPGVIAGTAVGSQVGAALLGFLGVKSVVGHMVADIPLAAAAYAQGVGQAWAATPDRRLVSRHVPRRGASGVHAGACWASRQFARGHEMLVLALLAGIVANLARGMGDSPALLADIGRSARLGPAVAHWVELHDAELADHPLLQTPQCWRGADDAVEVRMAVSRRAEADEWQLCRAPA